MLSGTEQTSVEIFRTIVPGLSTRKLGAVVPSCQEKLTLEMFGLN